MKKTAISTQPPTPVTALPLTTKTARQSAGGRRAALQWQQAPNENGRCRIVLTGRPGGGKRPAADLFRREIGERVVIVPEGGIVAPIFDKRNAAVKKMMAQVIATCRTKGRKIGICGEAPDDYSEFAQFIVEQPIDSIALIPTGAKNHAGHPEGRREQGMIGRPNLRPLVRRQAGHSPAAGMNTSNL